MEQSPMLATAPPITVYLWSNAAWLNGLASGLFIGLGFAFTIIVYNLRKRTL